MKRENILITEHHTTKRLVATKFTAPGNIPAFDKWIAQPVWQKEVFKQIQKDQLASLLEAGKYLYKIPTKREEMWEKIFDLHKESDVIIKVKKEDVNTFLHELENRIPEITWASDVKIFETKYTIGDIYEELKTCDMIYFRLSKINTLSYSSDECIYLYKGFKQIDYLPPMRWDLFKKGRLVVKVDVDNYEDFYNKCEEEIGRKPLNACKGTFTVYYSKGTFHRRPYNDDVPYAKKVVNWEDVR